MAVLNAFGLISIILILPYFIAAHTHDCYYDDATKHVEYDCDGNRGVHFEHKTTEVLYCHNYSSAIDRSEIESISFHDCLISGFWDNRLNLDRFVSLRILNISSMGIDQFPSDQFQANRQLERIFASHNKLTMINTYIFDSNRKLIEVDLSYNQINRIYMTMFDNTPKLKFLNLLNNSIEYLWPWTFSNLLELEILNLNDNQIKQLDCELLSTLTERKSLDILINTLEVVQTMCKIDEKSFDLDIVISPKETATRLRVSDGKLQWIFTEDDFTRLQRMNFTNNGIVNMLNIDQNTNTIEIVDVSNYYTLDQFYTVECVFVFIAMIFAVICVYHLSKKCICSNKNYKKNLSVYSIEQSLLHNQYEKMSAPQACYLIETSLLSRKKMFTKIVCNFILFVLILPCFEALSTRDCYYNETKLHIQYICDGKTGKHFDQRTNQYLYCNNYYTTGIDRSKIQSLSFKECTNPKLEDSLYFFESLRIFNVSFFELQYIFTKDFSNSKHLERIIAHHNQIAELPANLFSNLPDLVELDFSFNQIARLDVFTFSSSRNLKALNISYNKIETVNAPIFSHLQHLKMLDLSDNRIKTIENSLFEHNHELKSVRLHNNQIKRLECGFLTSFADRSSIDIFINTLEKIEIICADGATNIDFDIVISPKETETRLHLSERTFQWIFTRRDFITIRHLNLSSSRIENISALMQEASPLLQTLDISNHFIGNLTAITFEKFTTLKQLYLKRSNLPNFDFITFYHLRNLEILDISYNNLNTVDFYLFLRNFKNLNELNLEGNNLTEIDSVTRSHFPKLSVLGISKNNFSCDYLVKFLLQWHDLKLIDNPTINQTHVDGADCSHMNQTIADDKVEYDNSYNRHLMALTIKYGFIFAGVVVFSISISFTIIKFKRSFAVLYENKPVVHNVIYDVQGDEQNQYAELLHS
ncbi:toll-like receptor Tollo [Contarinia nasturtii]|uniref:toll-like receptor Tollo n=1 Tax=Contarinia nasturtii TaxID=265458 RepID=UPI0012D37FC7|nr:toll-like receptor Tollo [Contarinia nasturtii]